MNYLVPLFLFLILILNNIMIGRVVIVSYEESISLIIYFLSITMEQVQMSLAMSQGISPPKKGLIKSSSKKLQEHAPPPPISSVQLAEKTKQAVDQAVLSLIDQNGQVKLPVVNPFFASPSSSSSSSTLSPSSSI